MPPSTAVHLPGSPRSEPSRQQSDTRKSLLAYLQLPSTRHLNPELSPTLPESAAAPSAQNSPTHKSSAATSRQPSRNRQVAVVSPPDSELREFFHSPMRDKLSSTPAPDLRKAQRSLERSEMQALQSKKPRHGSQSERCAGAALHRSRSGAREEKHGDRNVRSKGRRREMRPRWKW